jgi:hypothetical protein
MLASVATKEEKNPLVVVLLVAKRLVAVSAVAEALASVVCPDTEREEAEAVPKVEVPEIKVENVPVVNDGLGVRAIVLVPEKMMLEPAFM